MSWEQLRSIVQQNAQDQAYWLAQPPRACPNDGTPLQSGPNGERHWFGMHPGALEKGSPYERFIRSYETTISDLKRNGITVINCSRETALTCYPRMDLQQALAP